MPLALYQPDIPQNCGTLMRLGAALTVPIHIIEPCGFPWDDARIRRAGMDYIDFVTLHRHADWAQFLEKTIGQRKILLTTKGATLYTDFVYRPDDILLLGRESAGVPDAVHDAADGRVIIPMAPPARSLNVAISAAMVLGEQIRQCHGR